ncbi:MAG TPA: hypothetical protein VKR54_01840 [Candidatus Babeliales bacterium]|jgi:hypothetical protein|nr:hypothetical protein [Candidatus Babeliales bacterium]
MNVVTKKQLILLLFFFNNYTSSTYQASLHNDSDEFITIAILAKNKAHTLPVYLSCIEHQTWPAHKTYLYIRTNNNTDNTAHILREWIARVGKNYAKIYFDDTDITVPVQQYGQHEWNYTRLKVLGIIRQESVDWALAHNSHYFVADCDNFIYSDVIETMMYTRMPIIAPLLRCSGKHSSTYYSNYHEAIDHNGYYIPSVLYYNILDQSIKGLIEVPVVHCTYFVRREVLDKITYDDESARYEYVIFSDSARKQHIPQYIDNRRVYGHLTFTENEEELLEEPYLNTFIPAQ